MMNIRWAPMSGRWLPAGMAAVLWAVAAGSVVWWWLHAPRADNPHAAPASVTPEVPMASGHDAHVGRSLGQMTANTAPSEAQRRFQLQGVIAADSGLGSALLMVNDQPAQAFVQGQRVADGWYLRSVSRGSVLLSTGQGGATLELSLPVKP